jgi:hypothetical protein
MQRGLAVRAGGVCADARRNQLLDDGGAADLAGEGNRGN